MTATEEHFLLRLPDDVADEVREAIRGGGEIDLGLLMGEEPGDSSARQGTFHVNGRKLPAALCSLPTVVETYKSLDGATFYKSGYVRQTLMVAVGRTNANAQPSDPE